jgi:hypothetical protein
MIIMSRAFKIINIISQNQASSGVIIQNIADKVSSLLYSKPCIGHLDSNQIIMRKQHEICHYLVHIPNFIKESGNIFDANVFPNYKTIITMVNQANRNGINMRIVYN